MSRIKDIRSTFQYSQVEVDAVAFGQRLQLAAKHKGYSASDLSRLAGVSKQSMSSYWRGERFCSSDRLFALADVLGVDARWLITGETQDSSGEDRLLQAFRVMDEEAQDVTLRLTDLIVRPRS
jgi:transcriptional regulator with XRE-family HTH domain